MKPVFLDTSGLVALVNVDDQWHSAAESAWQDLIESGSPLTTTSLVLIEIGDGLAKVQFRKTALDLYERLHSSPRVEVIQTTPADEGLGWGLYRRRSDKNWGMTDCISMVIMQRLHITHVFSSDYHFAQAGFSILLPGDNQ